MAIRRLRLPRLPESAASIPVVIAIANTYHKILYFDFDGSRLGFLLPISLDHQMLGPHPPDEWTRSGWPMSCLYPLSGVGIGGVGPCQGERFRRFRPARERATMVPPERAKLARITERLDRSCPSWGGIPRF